MLEPPLPTGKRGNRTQHGEGGGKTGLRASAMSVAPGGAATKVGAFTGAQGADAPLGEVGGAEGSLQLKGETAVLCKHPH